MFVKLAVLAVLVYFGYTQGLPWIQRQLGSGGATASDGTGDGGEDAAHCVRLATRANDSLGGAIRDFAAPPIDLDAWEGTRSRVEGEISDARAECGCSLEACRKASSALDELQGLLGDWDSGFRSGRTPLNPARQQEAIYSLLNEAQGLAEEGR